MTWTHDLTTWGPWTPPAPSLKAGDIILLHFNETIEQDLRRALDLADAAGLKPAPLRDYVADQRGADRRPGVARRPSSRTVAVAVAVAVAVRG
ncbi:hypothetical protein [Streptomyces sp. NPDC051921]|uniref:hypothetical protein n=1 Tax=Streptomyces sp. NPDC051921 TaxID=3155806 RepID=UPI003422E6C5